MEEKWTTVLKPRSKWYELNIKELMAYRDLIFLFVKRNYTTRYKQTILGPLWLIINPLFTTLMYAVVFGGIAQIPTEGVPSILFYLGGNILWTYFAMCINQTSGTFVNNAGILGKVYFPRLVMPISTVLTGLLDFCIQLMLFLVIAVIYALSGQAIQISGWISLLPVLVLQIAILGMGIGVIVSSMTTKYRDLNVLVTFGVQLWMYASPIVYPLSQIPEKYRFIYLLNPVAPVITIFRYAFFGIGEIPFLSWGISWIVTLVILGIGMVLFNRVEKTFMDTV
ncbi:MAG: ABC transporter permease [Lachnospiraceae bacterium]|nr:ABC transporter permease [Lachnospiraceae bacterium]